MDLIILGVGLTVLIARDVYRTVRRKRKEKKLKKRLREAGLEYEEIRIPSSSRRSGGRPIPDPRTSRNHPDRPRAAARGRHGYGEGGAGGFGGDMYGVEREGRGTWVRSRTTDGIEFYYYHGGTRGGGMQMQEELSEYARMPTPPPAYAPPSPKPGAHDANPFDIQPPPGSPPPSTSSGIGQAMEGQYPSYAPPRFEHAYTSDGLSGAPERRRKQEGLETLVHHG